LDIKLTIYIEEKKKTEVVVPTRPTFVCSTCVNESVPYNRGSHRAAQNHHPTPAGEPKRQTRNHKSIEENVDSKCLAVEPVLCRIRDLNLLLSTAALRRLATGGLNTVDGQQVFGNTGAVVEKI
jgi:hypothetical protein